MSRRPRSYYREPLRDWDLIDSRRHGPQSQSDPEFEVEDNPITAVLLGPTGEVLSVWRERSEVEFGFQRAEP